MCQYPTISVILPVYQNAETLEGLHQQLCLVLEPWQPYELLFVDDACPANSLAVLEELAQRDGNVAVVALECNVGQHQAVLTGLAYSRGESVIIMDADLQDPPAAIPVLLTKLQEGWAAGDAMNLGDVC